MHNAAEAFCDLFKRSARLARKLHALIRLVQKIGDLDVSAEALAGRGHDDVAARGVALNDIFYAEHVVSVRHGRSAEFTYFNHS